MQAMPASPAISGRQYIAPSGSPVLRDLALPEDIHHMRRKVEAYNDKIAGQPFFVPEIRAS